MGRLRFKQLLEKLLKYEFPSNLAPKIFIGFSDITVLHLFLNRKLNWNTIHGPLALQSKMGWINENSIKTLKRVMFGELTEINIENLIPLNAIAREPKVITAQLIGGNITLIRDTGELIDLKSAIRDKFLIVEDVSISYREVDKFFERIKREFLKLENQPRGIIIGTLTNDSELESGQINNAVKDFSKKVEDYKIPVLRWENFGHHPDVQIVPLGSQSTLTLGEKPKLVMQSGVKNNFSIKRSLQQTTFSPKSFKIEKNEENNKKDDCNSSYKI